ncbi:ABC transporter ATP-binding protein [Cetobacterium sp.]|uniref:ABC transporter ATP-binding protein n=1 Tax=Cetobacterium sp. TaxID=2071632 RepID=UPI002FC5BFD4
MITFKNISLKFKNKIVLENFNLDIKKGEKILITGESGKGKTTLLRILLGFNFPNSGEVYVNHNKLDEKSITSIRNIIGYMPQSTPFINTNVLKLIRTILGYKQNKNIPFDLERILSLFEFFSLEKSILDKDIIKLSGGEKQRLAFIVIILLDRDIWILDEITSSLDQTLKEKVVSYILNTDKTVILVSHDTISSFDKFKVVNL